MSDLTLRSLDVAEIVRFSSDFETLTRSATKIQRLDLHPHDVAEIVRFSSDHETLMRSATGFSGWGLVASR
jgi:hypothetical protein